MPLNIATYSFLTDAQHHIVECTTDARAALRMFEQTDEIRHVYEIESYSIGGALRSAMLQIGLKLKPGSLLDRALGHVVDPKEEA